jgi:hypothetical protein
MPADQRQALATASEDVFVELFAQVFGLEKVQMLAHEYPVEDIYGKGRFVDYGLRRADEKVAFEIDGPTHYSGHIVNHEDDLLRQISLVLQGWRVFRWIDCEVINEFEGRGTQHQGSVSQIRRRNGHGSFV